MPCKGKRVRLLFCNMSNHDYEKVRTGSKDNQLEDMYKKKNNTTNGTIYMHILLDIYS